MVELYMGKEELGIRNVEKTTEEHGGKNTEFHGGGEKNEK